MKPSPKTCFGSKRSFYSQDLSYNSTFYLDEAVLTSKSAQLEDMMEEEPTVPIDIDSNTDGKLADEEGVDVGSLPNGDATRGNMVFPSEKMINTGTIRTLDGEMAGDELEGDAINYNLLLGKIDRLLDRLKLDA